ncbi:hypothetical protein ACLMJK_007473 [Lecanora helva]
MQFSLRGLILASSLSIFTLAQDTCYFAIEIEDGQTYYYAPSDADDFGVYTQSMGACSGPPAQIFLQYSTGQSLCDSLPLDGARHLINCPNFPRGSAPEDAYSYVISTYYGYEIVDFFITHQQTTVGVPAAPQTVTITPTDTVTNTITMTQTDTYFSPQVIVSSPTGSTTNTITVTPSKTQTMTVTSTKTIAFIIPKFTQVQTTTTSTASCSQATLKPCPTRQGSPPSRPARSPRRLQKRSLNEVINQRDTRNGGEGVAGDGPLITTTTDAPVLTTVTAPDSTTTITITTAAPVDASTTVANPTPTTTIYSGINVSNTTTTLPQSTKTKTQYALTITPTVTTKTVTFIKTRTTTPICTPTHK